MKIKVCTKRIKAKSIFTIILFAFSFYQSNYLVSQDAAQYVFASQGNYNESEHLHLSWTLGDSFINSFESDEGMISQGFQQSFIFIKEVNQTTDKITAKIYPNPTSALLNIEVSILEKECQIEVFDISGRLLNSSIISQLNTSIDLSNYASGLYFIKLREKENGNTSIFEIIKL